MNEYDKAFLGELVAEQERRRRRILIDKIGNVAFYTLVFGFSAYIGYMIATWPR